MVFTLEALQGRHGDALLLHFGKPKSPQLMVIDGGPSGVYREALSPRLQAIKQSRSKKKPLPIRMLMVSHIDDDHIRGILDLTRELSDLQKDGVPLPYDIQTLWYNSFDDVVGNRAAGLNAAAVGAAAAAANGGGPAGDGFKFTHGAALVVASVPQGRRLRDDAAALGLDRNEGFGGKLVKAPRNGVKRVEFDPGLAFTVLGPSEERLRALQEEWDLQLEAMAAKAENGAAAAEFKDRSVFNLSSIVVLAEADGRTMLLTGDARGDFVLEGLTTAGLLPAGGQLHVDLFKLPHHGSVHNVTEDFFRQITADHYVISADGKHGNPDLPTLRALTRARGGDSYTIHLTNSEPRLQTFFNQDRAGDARSYSVVFRDPDAKAVLRIDLGEPLRK